MSKIDLDYYRSVAKDVISVRCLKMELSDLIKEVAASQKPNTFEIMPTPIYILIMRRWGDDESHSYPAGIFTDAVKAHVSGLKIRQERGGKYDPFIYECENLNEPKGVVRFII